jgi:hypothetical protein
MFDQLVDGLLVDVQRTRCRSLREKVINYMILKTFTKYTSFIELSTKKKEHEFETKLL